MNKKIILEIEYTCKEHEIIDYIASHEKIGKIHEVKTLNVRMKKT